jgi:hypothetical protein
MKNNKKIKHMIFSNYPDDIDETYYRDEFQCCYGEKPSDEALDSFISESLESSIEFERDNLNIFLPEEIVTFAHLQLWNGQRFGYRESRATNINELLYSNYDYSRWYVNAYGELCCDDTHHDGTNHYFYRMWVPGTSEEMKEKLLNLVYDNDSRALSYIKRYTVRLGDYIGDVYGWKFGHRPLCTMNSISEAM